MRSAMLEVLSLTMAVWYAFGPIIQSLELLRCEVHMLQRSRPGDYLVADFDTKGILIITYSVGIGSFDYHEVFYFVMKASDYYVKISHQTVRSPGRSTYPSVSLTSQGAATNLASQKLP